MREMLSQLQLIFSEQQSEKLYLVGGCVRDHLLGRTARDLDLVATLDAESMVQAGFRLVEGKTTTPIWFRHLPGLGAIEISLLPDGTSLHADLQRRDFTINAMALSLSGLLIDPLNGQSDLQQRLLRSCSNDSFLCDPLRLFRAFRFEAEGWQMDSATEQLVRGHDWSDLLEMIPVERFSREMVKALSAPWPERFFQRLLEFGIGDHWLPELFRMPLVPAGPLEYHPEGDLFSHAMQVMQRVVVQTDAPLARFCALFHDIGKLSTDPALYPRHYGHDEAGFAPALELCQRLKLPTGWGRGLAWTARLHTKANNWHELRDSTRIRLAIDASRAGIQQILPLVSTADKHGVGRMDGWETVLQVAQMNADQLGIEPERLESIQPSKRPEYLLQKRVDQLLSLDYRR